MAHLLIPTDLSANAFNAATYAVHLYGAEGNTFTLLHTYLLPFDAVTESWTADVVLVDGAREGLAGFAQRLQAHFGNKLDLRQTNMPGEVSGAVLALADDPSTAPDLVVMGTQGASGLQEVLIGTHTADVIKRCNVPVLTVPEQATYRIPRRIVIADDGGPVDRASLRTLLDVARWSHAEIMVVRVAEGQSNSETADGDSPYDAVLGAIPRSYHTVSGDNVTSALHDMADQNDADLVVVMHRHRSLFEQLFHRSTAARLAMHTHIPMLVLQQTAS